MQFGNNDAIDQYSKYINHKDGTFQVEGEG